MCDVLPLIAYYLSTKFHLNPISSCLSYLSDMGSGERTDGQSDDYMPSPLRSLIKGTPQLLCVHF